MTTFAEGEHDGYVLVFDRDVGKGAHKLSVHENGRELLCEPPLPDLPEDEGRDPLFRLTNPNPMLGHFLKYDFVETDAQIFCIVSLSEGNGLILAHGMKVDLRVNAEKSVRRGREEGFALAWRTNLPEDESKTDDIDGNTYAKKDLSLWRNLHLRYDIKCKYQDIYKLHGKTGKRLPNRILLRLLNNMLILKAGQGGAGLKIEANMNDKKHPMCAFFALHDQSTEIPVITVSSLTGWKGWFSFWEEAVNPIRHNFGERTGFYFLFLSRMSKMLVPFAFLGFVYFFVQVGVGRIDLNVFSDLLLLFIATTWSTWMLLKWITKEWEAKIRWGMLRANRAVLPRPEYEAPLEISVITGDLAQQGQDGCQTFVKFVLTNLVVLFFMGVTIGIQIGVLIVKSRFSSPIYTTAIQIINTLLIMGLGLGWNYVVVFLNDWQAHRMQEEYDGALVGKKVAFAMVNHFNSLFFQAFAQPWYCEVTRTSCTNSDILNNMRTTLAIQFLMIAVVKNVQSIGMSALMNCIGGCCGGDDNKIGLTESLASDVIVDVDDADRGKLLTVVTEATVQDIETQMGQPQMVNLLDETFEGKVILPYAYMMLFVIVFPLMPLLGMINNMIRVRLDLYTLATSRRDIPREAGGLGVWRTVLGQITAAAAFTNTAIICYRTNAVKDLVGERWVDTFFWAVSVFIVGVQLSLRGMGATEPGWVRNIKDRHLIVERKLVIIGDAVQRVAVEDQEPADNPEPNDNPEPADNPDEDDEKD